MNKKILTRVSSLLIVVAMAALMFVSFMTPAFGQSYDGATLNGGVSVLDGIKTNWQQYLDNSVVTRLPETIKSTDEISVIIKLDNPALMDAYEGSDKTMSLAEFAVSDEAAEIRKEIAREKSDYLAKLDAANIEYATGVNYDTVLAGFEIVIKASSFAGACELLDKNAVAVVGEVYKVAETQLVNNKVDFYEGTGIFDSSDFGFDGSGTVIAVLDTGLDYTHSAFDPSRFTSTQLGLTKAEVEAILADTEAAGRFPGLSADDVYLNDKVPFSFDYADNDADVYSMHNNHGTHVSGVIVGKDDVITGVAPNAQLVSMKIFSDTVDSARSSWILAALEDCVVLGVDVINMSLGTACGFSRENDKEIISGVYDRIRASGISLIVAASNSYNSAYASEKNGNLPLTSNPDSGTVGSPSTYDGALSVASIDGKKTPYILYNGKIVYFVEATNAAQKEKDFFNEILPTGIETLDIEYVLIPGAGRPADYTGLDMTNKIALVRRGSNTFEEKANAAAAAGAAGIIIFNNVAGDIRMNAGTIDIPICSIGQDDGEMLAAAGEGTIRISKAQTSGPFISDFSSWGPTPDLGIKPEITAHGGNILSAVTANTGENGYDRLSGTSMACPNMAGAVALMRQYVMKTFPEIADDPVEVAALVNRLFMSTADIMLNKNGLPYAVRKQGAGLANLDNSKNTTAYIVTYDREDGSVMDKSKIELGDDPTKSGVYTLKFSVNNFGYYDLTYDVSAYVLTEGVSETKTHAGETTVTETAYSLDGAKVEIVEVSGGTNRGMKVTVPAGEMTDVTVRITLSDADKKYLDDSFENGMYVEGFVVLDAVSGTDVGLSVPYLAFYGDWTKAPIFDLDYFETNADELDDSIELLDKTLPDAYATRPVGGLNLDYITALGSFQFTQDPANEIIAADRDKISLTNTEESIHSLRYVYAGLLRNAQRVVITITNSATGEIVYQTVDEDIRKSYGDGGSIYPASVEIEFDVMDYDLPNNSQYDVKLEAYLDYGDGGVKNNEKNTFEFPFTVDYQAPTLNDVEFYTEYDRDLDKMRLFAKMAVYDNHYAMAMQVGYISLNTEYDANDPEDSPYILNNFNSYFTPVYSERDSVSYVTYELTDYIYEMREKALKGQSSTVDFTNTIAIACIDYALNEATYQVNLPDDITDFYFSDTELTLSENEVFTLEPEIYPGTEWSEFLVYRSYNSKVVNAVGNKIVAVGKGETVVEVKNPATGQIIDLTVKVLGEGDPGFQYYDKPVAEEFTLRGFETLKAYYDSSSMDNDIDKEGAIKTFNGHYSIKLYPSESVALIYELQEYFPDDTTVIFETSNDKIVSVDENGVIVANAEGYASVTVSVYLDGEVTYYSETVDIEVKDPFITTGPSLTHYYGNGGTVTFPETLELTEIGNFAFSAYDWIEKGEDDEISDEEPTLTKQWFIGESTITKVVIPEGIEKIGAYAFAGLTALQEVVFPSTLEAIEYGAFYNCVSLKKLTWSGDNNVQLINKNAFYNCPITGELNLSGAHAISDYAFAVNNFDPSLQLIEKKDWDLAKLTKVILPETVRSIGAYAFYGQRQLKSVQINATSAKFGPYVFANCSSLEEMRINTAVIPTGAFSNCRSLKKITLGPDVSVIGEYAFNNTDIASFTVEEGNTVYHAQKNGEYLMSADGTTLLLLAPAAGKNTSYVFAPNDANITKIGAGAFSSNTYLTEVNIPSVTEVYDYAFTGCTALSRVNLGALAYVGNYAFTETAITKLPSFAPTLKKIGDYAFAYTALKEVIIPDGMILGECSFAECKQLEAIMIGNNVVIGNMAFMNDPTTSIIDPDNHDVPSYIDPDNSVQVFYPKFISPITFLTIGDNAVIGNSAFFFATELKTVYLGKNAKIGDYAFYSAASLERVNGIEYATSIGSNAFSGAVFNTYIDRDLSDGNEYVKNNYYVFKYYAPKLTSVDLSSATYIGPNAFFYCEELTEVKLGAALERISDYAFSSCFKLEKINLKNVDYISVGAFAESGIKFADLSGAVTVDEYAFTQCDNLTEVIIGTACSTIREGAFANSNNLSKVISTSTDKHGNRENGLKYVSEIGAYAFANTKLTDIDLTMAVSVDDFAFMKTEFTEVTLKLGELLNYIGDNPFAMSVIDRSCLEKPVLIDSFNGKENWGVTATYEITENVMVIDGSIYCKVPAGLELILYTGNDKRVTVADNTVRLSAYAFAGADVEDVALPYTLKSIGHKAFYGCDELDSIIFTSYYAPNLEESYDADYFADMKNIPGAGSYAYEFMYHNSHMETRTEDGMAVVPYFMWGVSSNSSNFFYGANFIDYIGHGEKDIEMVRPVNGVDYETFIYGQYFTDVKDGAAAADNVTLAAIEAINKLVGVRVSLDHEQLVIEARAAYDKIATELQRAIISEMLTEDGTSLTNVLTAAERRIEALKSVQDTTPEVDDELDESTDGKDGGVGVVIAITAILLVGGIAIVVVIYLKDKKGNRSKR